MRSSYHFGNILRFFLRFDASQIKPFILSRFCELISSFVKLQALPFAFSNGICTG